jgi:hypothetical protein
VVNIKAVVAAAAAALAVAACGSTALGASTPARTVTVTATPAASIPVSMSPKTTAPKTTQPATTPETAHPATQPAPPPPALTSGVAVVTQYYQDITDHNYTAAWAIGGSNLAAENGQTYASWEAGYADTTASITITSYGTWSNGTVWCYISAVQYSGAVNTYYGTYNVSGGVITSASIRQVLGRLRPSDGPSRVALIGGRT